MKFSDPEKSPRYSFSDLKKYITWRHSTDKDKKRQKEPFSGIP
jgi:hypothetical protein